MSSIRRVPLPAIRPVRRQSSVLALPVAALAVAGAAWVAPTAAQARTDAEPPQARRDALLARVAAVRHSLQQALHDPTTLVAASTPTTEWPLLTAQATTWTNWPKWSKWSNWANK
jgi:hypothetical protein